MKICYTVFLCLIFQFCFGQINDFEGLSNHEDYSSYRQVVFKSFMGSTTEYNLKKSRVTDLIFYFSKDNIVRKESFIYDTIGNLISVNNYNIANNELLFQTNYILKYDDLGRILEKDKKNYIYKGASKLPEKITTLYPEVEDSAFSLKKEFLYDDLGNVKSVKNYYYIQNQLQVDIEQYQYDKFQNVVKLERKSIPEKEYPIIMIGGYNKHKTEEFEYVYNQKQLWIKKYRVVDGKKTLIAERDFFQ